MKKNLLFKSSKLHQTIGQYWSICILSLLATFIIISCTKKEANLQEDLLVVNDITFHDGRLIFKDVTSFMNHQKWLYENQGNPQLIADKNKSLGLKSMTEYYLEGIKLEENDPNFLAYVDKYPNIFNKEVYDNSTLYLLPHSKLLCYIANKDGIFQVGDKIYRIVLNYVYEITDGDESKIEILFLPKDKISDKNIKITPSHSVDAKNDYGQRTRYFSNNKYRIVSSLREFVAMSVWYNEIQTNPQKKTLGVWLRAQLNTKSAIGDGYITALNCPSCPWHYPIYASNDEETGLSFNDYYMGDYQLDMSESHCPAYSRGRLITDGIPQWIYVYWYDALDSSPTFFEPEDWTPEDEPF
jgi:hypothetical protein